MRAIQPRFLTIATLATLGAACGGGGTEPGNQQPGPGGTTVSNVVGKTNRTVTVGGMNRTFIVYVGTSVGAKTAAPVVFMVHGTSGDGEKFYNISRWKEKADEVGLIAVFPDALTYCFFEDENVDGDFTDPGEAKLTTKWAHGDLGDPAKMPLCSAAQLGQLSAQNRALADHPLQDDVAFMDAIINFLKQHYVIDDKRLFATGFSNGAQFVSRLAVDRGNVFAALAAHAGNLVIPPVPGRPMTFVASIGEVDDRLMAYTGAPLPLTSSLFTTYPLVKSLEVTPMLTQLRLADQYAYDAPTVSGKKLSRFTYQTSTAGASNRFTFVVIEGNTHFYPNGVEHPVVMANLLWPIFAAERLP